mmetsp:Transcript_90702/g.157226  ORF Transcript_90702/g.157226 Transcript_90702/m.157226 type:complete len:690 (+) Transcript_90702:283-2352(+)
MLRSHTGVVQSSRNTVGLLHLPRLVVLEKVRLGTMDNADATFAKRGSILVLAIPSSLHAEDRNALILDERVEGADCVAAAAGAREDLVRQAADLLERLLAGLAGDDGLEVADHRRKRVGAHTAADHVVGVVRGAGPITQGLIHGIVQRLLPRLHRHHFGAQGLHPQDVELLPHRIQGPHVHHALQAKQGAHSGGGHPVLPCPGLSDHATLAQPLRQQCLAQGVVDLVGPSVQQVLPLEPDGTSHPRRAALADILRQFVGLVEQRRPPGVLRPVRPYVRPEVSVVEDPEVLLLQVDERGHEDLRHKLSPELAEIRWKLRLGQAADGTDLPVVLHFVGLHPRGAVQAADARHLRRLRCVVLADTPGEPQLARGVEALEDGPVKRLPGAPHGRAHLAVDANRLDARGVLHLVQVLLAGDAGRPDHGQRGAVGLLQGVDINAPILVPIELHCVEADDPCHFVDLFSGLLHEHPNRQGQPAPVLVPRHLALPNNIRHSLGLHEVCNVAVRLLIEHQADEVHAIPQGSHHLLRVLQAAALEEGPALGTGLELLHVGLRQSAGGEQLQQRDGVRSPHQRRSDQQRPHRGGGLPDHLDIRRVVDPTEGDPNNLVHLVLPCELRVAHQRFGAAQVQLEGLQVTIVDANHLCPGLNGDINLVFSDDLHQGLDAEAAAEGNQAGQGLTRLSHRILNGNDQ